VEGCPEKKTTRPSNNDTETNHSVVAGVGTNSTGPEIHDETLNGPWVVVQKPRRPRRNKEGNSKDEAAAGHAQNAGTGTRFEILDSINGEPEILGANNEERNNLNIPTKNTPHSAHTKNRGKSGKHVEDKKGKAVNNMVQHESTNGQVIKRNNSGASNVYDMQLSKETNNDQLGRQGALQHHDVSKRITTINYQHEMIAQGPQQLNGEGQHVDLTHMAPHHMPRPPDQSDLGRSKHKHVNDSMEQVVDQQSHHVQEEMEIVNETHNLDQQEGGVKSMILT
jgi:hypothetical protein